MTTKDVHSTLSSRRSPVEPACFHRSMAYVCLGVCFFFHAFFFSYVFFFTFTSRPSFTLHCDECVALSRVRPFVQISLSGVGSRPCVRPDFPLGCGMSSTVHGLGSPHSVSTTDAMRCQIQCPHLSIHSIAAPGFFLQTIRMPRLRYAVCLSLKQAGKLALLSDSLGRARIEKNLSDFLGRARMEKSNLCSHVGSCGYRPLSFTCCCDSVQVPILLP